MNRARSINFGDPAEHQAHEKKCQKRMLGLDFYRQPFHLILPDQSDRYRSFIGSIMSLITSVLLLLYAGYKLNIMVRYRDYKIQQ